MFFFSCCCFIIESSWTGGLVAVWEEGDLGRGRLDRAFCGRDAMLSLE